MAHKCAPNSKSSHRIRKAHTEFEKPTPNSKSPHRIRKAHTEFEKPTPNSKSPHQIRKAHTEFKKPHTEFQNPHRIPKPHTEFEIQFRKAYTKCHAKLISSPLLLLFTLQALRAIAIARWARNANVARCVFLHVIAIGISVCFVKTAGISTTHVRTIVRNAAQVRKFFYSCCFSRLMCQNLIKSLTLNHASHVVICVHSISLSD